MLANGMLAELLYDGTNLVLLNPSKPRVYVGNDGDTVISTTYIDVHSVVTQSTWESVGPTGSGADNIWTALDSVPDGMDWIELSGYMNCGDTSGTSADITVYARENGTTPTLDSRCLLATAAIGVGGASSVSTTISFCRKVPVTSGKLFDLYWVRTGDAQLIRTYITGYGVN